MGPSPASAILEGVTLTRSLISRVFGFLLHRWGWGCDPSGAPVASIALCAGCLWPCSVPPPHEEGCPRLGSCWGWGRSFHVPGPALVFRL